MAATHTFEPELDQPLPRRGMIWPRLRMGQIGLTLFFTPFVLVGIFMAIWAVQADAIFLAGERIQGEVVDTEEGRDSDGDPTYKARVDYRSGGESHRGSISISAEQFRVFGPGTPVALQHLQVPFGSPVAQDGAYAMPLFITVFALFWDGFMAVLTVAFVRQVQKAVALLRLGTVSRARITAKATDDSGDSTTYSVNYEFLADGRKIESSDTVSSLQWDSAQVGHSFTVLYLPEKPETCALFKFI